MAALGMPAYAAVKPSAQSYGSKVKYSKGATLHFPDFDLTYIGRRKESSEVFKPGFTFEDFRVSQGARSDTVSWTSGTGLIVPRQFKFRGNTFQLMLYHGGTAGKLKSDELIVVKM
ncbi:hypothetical protein DES53_106269 [Roseimicrobium gellanilyticum]|uniref:Uncharacterized protein n=1 Tax=Roseimicrobium gellanilyticum TaxID=748857 RepID=A0A366HKC4_9BACT|nr:hypothetical protein [Roseimicrobium gellanilyticum]RBP42560.1 hypothetical protein DES53_106269 [Roseimicrobium gellanilyticum]